MSPEIAAEATELVPGMVKPTDPVSPANARPVHRQWASCGGCDARWTDKRLAHCGACHRSFGGVGLFEQHRRAFACLDPATIEGLRLADGIWRGPELTDEQRERLGGRP